MEMAERSLVAGGDDGEIGYADQQVESPGYNGGFECAGGKVNNVVSLKDRIGVLTQHHASDVDLDEGSLAIHCADDAEILKFARVEGAAGNRGCLQKGQRGVLLNRNEARNFEFTEHVNDTDTREDDGVSRVEGNVDLATVHGVVAKIDDDGLVYPGTVDGEGVAGACRQAASGRENF